MLYKKNTVLKSNEINKKMFLAGVKFIPNLPEISHVQKHFLYKDSQHRAWAYK